jgi:hypothetical protein
MVDYLNSIWERIRYFFYKLRKCLTTRIKNIYRRIQDFFCKGKDVCKNNWIALICGFLILLHYTLLKSGFLSFLPGIIFLVYLACLARKVKISFQQLILYLIILFFLIIPVREYDDTILSLFRNIRKIGQVEFYKIDEFVTSKKRDNIASEIQSLKKNYINNGSFEISLFSNQSRWGTGYYSNLLKSLNPSNPIYFIRFGNVDIKANIDDGEYVEGKHSLYVRNLSAARENVVGVLEQEIYLEPAEYTLSLKVKANYMINTTIWIRLEPEVWLGGTGIDISQEEIRKKGGFDTWVKFSFKFCIDQQGYLLNDHGIVLKEDFIGLDVDVEGLFNNLIERGYIDNKGKIQDAFRELDGYSNMRVAPIYENKREQIYNILKRCKIPLEKVSKHDFEKLNVDTEKLFDALEKKGYLSDKKDKKGEITDKFKSLKTYEDMELGDAFINRKKIYDILKDHLYVKFDKINKETNPSLFENGYLRKEEGGKQKMYFKTTFSIIVRDQCEFWIDDIVLKKE